MTDEQINQRIAEACGWTEVKKFDWLFGIPPHNAGVFCRVHNYAGCLNTMHEAVMTLSVKQRSEFRNQLQYLIASPTNVSGISHYDEWWNATARQRAEAFLRTIGKWEEEA